MFWEVDSRCFHVSGSRFGDLNVFGFFLKNPNLDFSNLKTTKNIINESTVQKINIREQSRRHTSKHSH